MLKIIRGFFNGLAFGAIQTVPSISGGTIAIILGFYFDLIRAINRFREDRRKNLRFLIPLLLGTGAGILLFSSLMAHLLERHSLPAALFFMGLILGIAPHIYSKITEADPHPAAPHPAPPEAEGAAAGEPAAAAPARERPARRRPGAREILLILLPLALAPAMAALRGDAPADPAEIIAGITPPFMLFIFFAGMLAAAALVIPGVSGSFLLLMLGLYHVVIYSIRSIRVFLADAPSAELLLDILKVLGPLGLGIIAGGLSMLRLIERLLERHRRPVYSAILGLMLASALILADPAFLAHAAACLDAACARCASPPLAYRSGVSAPALAAGAAAFCAGCASSFFLGKKRL